MAELARGTARKKIPALVDALQAHRMSDHHRTMIRFSVEHLQFLEQQLQAIDAEILKKINEATLSVVVPVVAKHSRRDTHNRRSRPTVRVLRFA